MTTAYTSLLGLALPVTGELSGTWGDTVNNYITQYIDAAVAGAQTISGTQTAVTLSVTNGTSLSQAGPSSATGSSQYQIINCTGNPASALTIDVPKASKAYLVLNNTSTNQTVTVRGGPTSPTTGVTVAAAQSALIAWNGLDFELVATTDITKLSGILAVASGGTGQSSYTDGQLLIGNSTGNTLTKSTLTAGSGVSIANGSGSITISATGLGGTVTSVGWTGGIVSVATATTTPAFTIAGTSGGVPYFSSGTTWASSGALAANALVVGGGAGAAPSTITTGSGVVTAISNAVNATGGLTTINGTATLTNKRIDRRVSSSASASTLTPDISAFDQYNFTALAANLTINAPTGTPVDGNTLIIRILDNGSSRTLTWNATYTVVGVTLPGTTTPSKTLYVGCVYNANNTRWDVVAVNQQI